MRWFNFFHIYQPPAWDEVIVRRVADESYRPVLSILEANPKIRITLNITGSLTEQLQVLGLSDILTRLRALVERGQVELVGSAMYHPILPLLPAAEVRRQIELQETLRQKVFGRGTQPRGFYCPEMAYDPNLESLLKKLGYEWVILDEICANVPIGQIAIDHQYLGPSGLRFAFRNRHISDYLSFSSDLANPADGVRAITEDCRSIKTLVTAMDGENLGHHRHGVEKLWEFLVTYPGTETGTLSEFFASAPTAPLTPQAGSWSSQPSEITAHIPFGLWNHPANPVHRLQWELTYAVITAVNKASTDQNHPAARRLLDQALASDRYWWASASPWWDLPIIIRETQRLADTISPLSTLPATTRYAVERLAKEITTTVELWDRTGLAKRRQSAYLKDFGTVHYMGGQRV